MASKSVICNLDLNGNQIENVVLQVLSSAPATPVAGQFYYDSAKTAIGYYNGTAWVYVDNGNVYAVDSLTDDSVAKIVKVYQGSSNSTSGNDTLTTFTFRALKSDSPYITLAAGKDQDETKEYIKIGISNLSTSTTLVEPGSSAASDSVISSQAAIKTYIDNAINAVNTDIAGSMHWIGTWDGSKTIAQNVATAGQAITKLRKGDYWIVNVEGSESGIPSTSGGGDDNKLHVGDMVVGISNVTTIANATASDFKVIDNTESSDLVRNSRITTSDALNSNTSTNKTTIPSDYTVGKAIQTSVSNSVHQYKAVVTTGTSTTITAVTHGCGKYPEVKVYQKSGSAFNEVLTSVSINSSGDVSVDWNTAATTNASITIVILGNTVLS